MSPILEPLALVVDALSQDWQGRSIHISAMSSAQQSHSETTCHPGSRSDTDSSLLAITSVVSTPTSTLCGPPSVFPILPRSTVTTGTEIHLGRKVIPSACMEVLMQHYKAAGFLEVSRLVAAHRRPSTNRMYDDRWLRFTHWAAREGFDTLSPTAAQIATFLYSLFDTHGLSPQTVKGYTCRTCLGSVLNRMGKAKVVQHKTISDMIASMELQRPRFTPVLLQWDLGIVLKLCVDLPGDPWYIPVVSTDKSEFVAPKCPVRALRYYHRYLF